MYIDSAGNMSWTADVKRVLANDSQMETNRDAFDRQISRSIESFCISAKTLLNTQASARERECLSLVASASYFKDSINTSLANYHCEYDFRPIDPLSQTPARR